MVDFSELYVNYCMLTVFYLFLMGYLMVQVSDQKWHVVLFKIGQVVTFALSYIILEFHTHFGCRTLNRKFTEVMLVSPRGLTKVVT